MVTVMCAKRGFPSGHPIVVDNPARTSPGHHPFHCWLMLLPFMGPGAGLSDIIDSCWLCGAECSHLMFWT